MLGRVVTEAAGRWGDGTAFVASDGWFLSFAELDRCSDEVARGLAQRGLGPGDVVAIVVPSCPEYVVIYAAAAKLGAITAGVNARLTTDERAAVLDRADPAIIVTTDDLAPPQRSGDVVTIRPASSVSGAEEVLAELRQRDSPALPELPDDPERPVAIVFTSGTTGVPKGAVFGGRQLEFITETDTGWKWGGGSHNLAATSFAHLGPMTKLAGNLVRGTTQHLLDRWTARDALRLAERHRMPGFGGIPTQIALMLRDPEFDRFDLTELRAIVIGGGPATPTLVREARERFGAALSIRYSCTEAGIGIGTALTDPPEDAEVSVGRPHAGVELTIIDESGRPAADGEVGEVCLRSPAVMSGYYRDSAGTAEAFTAEGAVRTGDLGYLDGEGRLHLVGRAKEMYVRGGYNIYPTEVEAVLAGHPLVAELAVVPRADDVMGEIGVAAVVPVDPSEPPTLDELREFGAQQLAKHKLPEDLRLVDALPLTAMDKVDRRALTRSLG